VSVVPVEGNLADYHSTVLVLRLVLDAQGHLTRGELLDGDATLLSRFVGKRGLARALRQRLEEYEEDGRVHSVVGPV
jgi:hypothetical protein